MPKIWEMVRFEAAEGGLGWITIHPSFLLRMPDKARAEEAFEAFVEDLKGARKAIV